ncbi:hypothetical protein D3C80_803090 [compost metagenome]
MRFVTGRRGKGKRAVCQRLFDCANRFGRYTLTIYIFQTDDFASVTLSNFDLFLLFLFDASDKFFRQLFRQQVIVGQLDPRYRLFFARREKPLCFGVEFCQLREGQRVENLFAIRQIQLEFFHEGREADASADEINNVFGIQLFDLPVFLRRERRRFGVLEILGFVRLIRRVLETPNVFAFADAGQVGDVVVQLFQQGNNEPWRQPGFQNNRQQRETIICTNVVGNESERMFAALAFHANQIQRFGIVIHRWIDKLAVVVANHTVALHNVVKNIHESVVVALMIFAQVFVAGFRGERISLRTNEISDFIVTDLIAFWLCNWRRCHWRQHGSFNRTLECFARIGEFVKRIDFDQFSRLTKHTQRARNRTPVSMPQLARDPRCCSTLAVAHVKHNGFFGNHTDTRTRRQIVIVFRLHRLFNQFLLTIYHRLYFLCALFWLRQAVGLRNLGLLFLHEFVTDVKPIIIIATNIQK